MLNAWFYNNGVPAHRSISTVDPNLINFLSRLSQAGGRSVNGGYAKLYHDWWVRGSGTTLFPTFGWGTANKRLSLPLKTTDLGAPHQPIITDAAGNQRVTVGEFNSPKLSTHFQGSSLSSSNCGYADGYVESTASQNNFGNTQATAA